MHEKLLGRFQLYILLTIALAFDSVVRYRQRHRRLTLSVYFNVRLLENRFAVLFEPFALKRTLDDTYEYDLIDYRQADESVKNFLKYFVNFVFYRFGLEVKSMTVKRSGEELVRLAFRSVTSPWSSSSACASMSWLCSTQFGSAFFLFPLAEQFNGFGHCTFSS